jgi:hypothetical protein
MEHIKKEHSDQLFIQKFSFRSSGLLFPAHLPDDNYNQNKVFGRAPVEPPGKFFVHFLDEKSLIFFSRILLQVKNN